MLLTSAYDSATVKRASASGLAETDRFMEVLSAISGRPISDKQRRWRSRLMDAMVDSHYQFGNKKVAIALESDNLKTLTGLPAFDRLGAHQKVWVGYSGTLNLVFETANLFQANAKEAQKLAHD